VNAALSAGTLVLGATGTACPGDPNPCGVVDLDLPDPPEDLGGGSGQPPVLLEASVLSATVLELRFSKPIAAVNDVDPADFRVSLATTATSYYSDCAPQTSYQDLAASSATTGVWNIPEDPHLLRLSLAAPVTPAHCTIIDNARAAGNEGGLFLHYSAGDGASVQDADGNGLADIAAPWVLFQAGAYYYAGYTPPEFYFCNGAGCTAQGAFPNMASWLPIPCPRPA